MNIMLMISGPQIVLIVAFFLLIFPIIALIDILRNEYTNSNKIVWLIVVLMIPFIGSFLYYFIGTKHKIKN